MLYIEFHAGNLLFQSLDIILRLFRVKFQDTLHLDLQQQLDIIICHRADQLRQEGFQALAHVYHHLVHRFTLLELLILVYTFFNKYLFQR